MGIIRIVNKCGYVLYEKERNQGIGRSRLLHHRQKEQEKRKLETTHTEKSLTEPEEKSLNNVLFKPSCLILVSTTAIIWVRASSRGIFREML